MERTHLIQLLRKMEHPRLQEFLVLIDRWESLSNQVEHIADETAALTGKQRFAKLEQRYETLIKQFWWTFYEVQELQERIIQSLHTPGYRNYKA